MGEVIKLTPATEDEARHGAATLRLPPHNIEAERGLLGALLIDNGAFDRVGGLLSSQDFYRYEHRLVHTAISQLVVAGKPADVITVFEKLESVGRGEEAGGLAYLNSLAQTVPSSGAIQRHAEIVRERSVLRQLAAVGDEIAASALATDGRPVVDRLQEAEAKVFAIANQDAGNKPPTNMHGLIGQLLDLVQARADDPRDVVGLATGFIDIDRMTTGLQPGDLVVLAARPSMGKTAFALNIAEHVSIKEGLPVAVFSMEMGSLQLAFRLVAQVGRIDIQRLRTGKLRDEEWSRLTEAVERLGRCPMEIDESPGMTVAQIRSSARRLARQHGGKLALIVVDYLQLMAVSDGMAKENRATAVGELSRGLKLLAKEMGCPVLALSQLSRNVESRTDKRPMMSDLRESGAIEQDADTIMFIYRDDYYNKDSREPGVAEIIISKQRNGPTGTSKLAFVRENTRFENLAFNRED